MKIEILKIKRQHDYEMMLYVKLQTFLKVLGMFPSVLMSSYLLRIYIHTYPGKQKLLLLLKRTRCHIWKIICILQRDLCNPICISLVQLHSFPSTHVDLTKFMVWKIFMEIWLRLIKPNKCNMSLAYKNYIILLSINQLVRWYFGSISKFL